MNDFDLISKYFHATLSDAASSENFCMFSLLLFFSAHAHLDTKRREPWLMPEENRQLIRQAVRTRYSLLPFWYTLFYESSKSGAPVMSPMWVHFPKDTGTFDMDDQYMLGTSILIKPVTSAGATSQEIYLPGAEGGRPSEIWYYQDGWQVRCPSSCVVCCEGKCLIHSKFFKKKQIALRCNCLVGT